MLCGVVPVKYRKSTEHDYAGDAVEHHFQNPQGNRIQPELSQLVLAGTHSQCGDAVDGHEVVDPAGTNTGKGQRNRRVAILHAQSHADGSKDEHGAEGSAGEGCADRGCKAEDNDQHEQTGVAAQQVRNILTNEAGQAAVVHCGCNADDGSHHDQDRGEHLAQHFLEGNNAAGQEDTGDEQGDAVAHITGQAGQEEHGDQQGSIADIDDLFLGLGDGKLELFFLLAGSSFRNGIGNIAVGQEAMHNTGIYEVENGHDHAEQAVLHNRQFNRNTLSFAQRTNDSQHHNGAAGQPASELGCEGRGHQNAGGGQVLVIGDSSHQADDQNVESGAGDQVTGDHDCKHQSQEAHFAALGSHVAQELLHLVDNGSLLDGCRTDHEAHDHDDVGVGKAAESGGYVSLIGDDQQGTGQNGRCAEGKLIADDNCDHQNDNCQGNDHR